MCTLDFDTWFADHLGERPEEVTRLLDDKTAVRFLIAWSLLEPRCFDGYAKGDNLSYHCQRLVNEEGFDHVSLRSSIEHFHSRYQDEGLHSDLMRGHTRPNIRPLLKKSLDELSNYEKVFLVVSVVFRYRNNIFHGSKSVESWLQYKAQMDYCIQIMQSLIAHITNIRRNQNE